MISKWQPEVTWRRLVRSLEAHDEFADSVFRSAPYWLVAPLLTLIHLGSTWFGYLLISGGAQVTPVFPEAGLDLVAIVAFGPRYWPFLFASYFGTDLWRQVAWGPALGMAAASLLRTLAAAWLFRRISGAKKVLGEFVDVASVGICSVIAPLVGAGLGTPVLILGGRFAQAQWAVVFSRWWVADALGILTVTPVLIIIARWWAKRRVNLSVATCLRLLTYLLFVSAICYFVFFRSEAPGLLFAVLGLILVGAAWLGTAAARSSALVIASAAIWATHMGVGAFVGGNVREDLANLDLFIAAISLTGIAVGAFRAVGSLALPGAALLAGWTLSGCLYASLDKDRVNYDAARLGRVISSVETRITGRLSTYENALWGAAGFIAASGQINQENWHVYVSRLQLLEHYPETAVMSVVVPVSEGEMGRVVEAGRRGERVDFGTHRERGQAGNRPEKDHLIIVSAEPSAVAARAVGGDLAGDERRKRAAEEARDSGKAVLTRSTAMRNGTGKALQLFVPVYRKDAPAGSVAERRSALVAWVTVVFGADPFFRGALADLQNFIGVWVYDEGRSSPGSLFFAPSAGTLPQHFDRTTRMNLGGSTWTFGWLRVPSFPFMSRTPSAWAAGCTALLSVLLAGLVVMVQATRRRAADRLKLIQSASALGTWELDVHSGMVHCSEQLLRLYGISDSRERLPMEEWLDHVHPDDREELMAELRSARGGYDSIDRQYRVIWPDGSTHWLHSKALLILDEEGRPARVVGVDFDVSEIKHLQSQLAHAQKLESVGQLAAGVAHEINTPVQYIGDNGKFLEEAFAELIGFVEAERRASVPAAGPADLEYLKEEVPKAITQLLEGVDQVGRIVRAMKEFSHPGPIEKASVDVNRAIESTILVSKNEWKYVAEVTTDFDQDLPPVPCVPGEFNQVILNLIVNAAHAIGDVVTGTEAKGRIHIETRQVDSAVTIRISDTGGGIPETIQARVFDPFFTTKPVGKGTGQGLAIAHSVIVQKHQGALTFETEPGSGTTFVIQLPLAYELEAV